MLADIPSVPVQSTTATTVVQQVNPGVGNVRKEAQKVITENNKQNILTGVIINNHTKNVVSNDTTSEHFAASINKIPMTVLLLEKLRAGALTLDTELTWTASDVRGGAGVFDQPGAPLRGTVRDLIKDMLHYSGNTAPRIVVNGILGGAPAVNEIWKSQYGLQHTYLVPLDGPGGRFYFGYTNAAEALAMFNRLVAGNDQYANLVRSDMADNIWSDMGVRSVKGDTTTIRLVNKIGYLDDPDGNNRHDVGMVINNKTGKVFSYAFLQTAPSETSQPTVQADAALKQFGVIVLRNAGDKAAGLKKPTPEVRLFNSPVQRTPEKRILL